MTYRKLKIDNTTYEYVVGSSHTKIKGVGVFLNIDIGGGVEIKCRRCGESLDTVRDADGNDKIGVTPNDITRAILNKIGEVSHA